MLLKMANNLFVSTIRHLMFKKTLIFFLTVFSTYLQSKELAFLGVWKGSLGDKEIIACFNYDDGASGNYYYLRYLQSINLVKNKKTGSWSEELIDAAPRKVNDFFSNWNRQ